VATRADDLRLIRRLSQYRPFERGGQSARERKEDLVVAGLAEAGGSCTSIGDCAAAINALWGLSYDELELADPIAHLIAEQRLVRDSSGSIALADSERRRLDSAAAASEDAARTAFAEWHSAICSRWATISPDELDVLDRTLEKFVYAVVQQHGAEATLLIYPEEPGARAILESADAKAQALETVPEGDERSRAEWALALFMRETTDARVSLRDAQYRVLRHRPHA
jgi:hypothetical protein